MAETESKLAVVIQYHKDRLTLLEAEINGVGEQTPEYVRIRQRQDEQKNAILQKLENLTKRKQNLEEAQLQAKQAEEEVKRLTQAYDAARSANNEEEAQNLSSELSRVSAAANNAQTRLNTITASVNEEYKISGKDFVALSQKTITGFEQQSSLERTKKRNELAENFTKHGFDKMPPNDAIIFIDQFSKGNLIIETSADNLKKIAEKLATLPQTDDRQVISHSKFNPLVRINRWRRRLSLTYAARKLQNLQQKHERKQAKVDYIFNGDEQDFKRLKWVDKATAWLQKPTRLAEVAISQTLDEKAHTKLLKQQQDRAKRIDNIARLESKITGKSAWNPKTWGNRLRLKVQRPYMMWQEKSQLKNAPLSDLQARYQMLSAESSDLQKTGDTETINYQSAKTALLEILKKECERAYTLKNEAYQKASAAVDKKFEKPEAKLREKVARRYDLINDKTDILENSTTTGRWLYAVLDKAPATKRKDLEATVRTRKNQAFTTEKEFEQYVKDQLEAGGYKKSNDPLMAIIAQAVAKEKKEYLSTGSGGETPGSVSGEAEENAGQVHEGHSSTPPAPIPEDLQSSEDNIKGSFAQELYEVVEPQREGVHKDNENVLVQTFKSTEDEHTLTIEKPDKNNYNLIAKDKEGKDSVPTVDDMKAAMQAVKKDGLKKIELGEVKTPEFLARAIVAAEESGIEISNLKEIREKMAAQGKEAKVKEELTKATAQKALKGTEIDVSSKDGLKKTINKLDALVSIQNKSPAEYVEYKESPEFKKLKLNAKEEKLFDGVNKLKNNATFKSQDERRQAVLLGRMVSNYQAAYSQKTTAGGAKTKAKQNFVSKEATKFNLGNTARSGSGR